MDNTILDDVFPVMIVFHSSEANNQLLDKEMMVNEPLNAYTNKQNIPKS